MNMNIRNLALAGLLVSIIALGAFGALGCCAERPAAETLSPEAQAAVLDALLGEEGEYAAYAMYAAIIEAYGSVNPFANIVRSEANHIAALQKVLDRYGVEYPEENPYIDAVTSPASLAEAAQAGVDAEIDNVALYEAQLAAVAGYADIVEVFVNLQTASQERHLPAFERAAARYGS
jgi:hypothetical protein